MIEAPALFVLDDVVGEAASTRSVLDAVPDRDSLYRRDRHQHLSESAVEALVPMHTRAEACGYSVGCDLDHAA
jgi:hypothetical protein